MATSAIGSTDLANLRGTSQHIDEIALHITPKVTIQTGTVTSVPTFSPYVQLGITWDGSYAGVSVGQMVTISIGSTIKAYAVIRKAPTASILYISTTPIGGHGYANEIQSAIAVDDIVTVYSHRPLWGLYSRIADRTFYKQWDIPYTNQNSQPPPVANAGTWQAAQVSVGDTASFTLPRKGSNSSFNFGSATDAARLWTLPSGVTLKSGYALTDAVIGVDAEAGYHLVSYTHTDSNAKVHTAYVWLFVSDGTTGASLSERYPVTIESDTQDTSGRIMQFTITGDDLDDVIYPGAGFLFREWSDFNGSSLTDGVLIDTFVGYVAEISPSSDGNVNAMRFTVESPFIYAARWQQPSQVLEEASSPAHWAQATSVLTNPRGFLYYAIKWHSPQLLDMHDFDAPFTTPRRKDARWQKGSLQSAMMAVAEYIAGHVGSASDGTTVMRENPMYMDNTDRNALAEIITWLDRDVQVPVGYTERFTADLSEARTGAFAYDGSTVKAWLAGKFWNQGVGNATLANFTVTPSEGLARILEVVGHFFQEANRPIQEHQLTMLRNYDIIDPAYWLWCRAIISAEFDAYGKGINTRCIVKRVNRQWTNDRYGWRKAVQLGLQPETFGQPGEEIPIASAASYQLNGYSLTIPTNFAPNQGFGAFGGVPIMLVNDDNGKLAITYNYMAASPQWANVTPFVNNESVNDFSIDYNSPYFQNGNNAAYALGLYVVTTSDTDINVWYFADVLTSPTATLLATESMNDSSNTTEARIEVSESTPTLVVVAWHDQTGIEFIRSTDGGANWSNKANIGSAISDSANDNAPIGLDIDGTNQLITAPDGSANYGAYLATTAGGSFSALSNTLTSAKPLPLVRIEPTTDTAYITALENINSDLITFDPDVDVINLPDAGDSATDPQVSINGATAGGSPAPDVVSSNGNPGWCARHNPTSGSWASNEAFQLVFDIASTGSPNTLNNITFDYYISSDIVSGATIVVIVTEDDLTQDTYTFSSLTADAWTTINVDADAVSSQLPTDIGNTFSNPDIVIQLKTNTTYGNLAIVDFDMRFDNIALDLDTSFGGSGLSTLYKVTDFDGTDSWTDISPASDEVPTRPHDLAIDLADTDIVNTYASGSTTWYQSTDAGSNWTSKDASTTTKRAFFTAGKAMAVAGSSKVELSLDGTNFEDKTGNLSTAWGSIGVIKRIQPL